MRPLGIATVAVVVLSSMLPAAADDTVLGASIEFTPTAGAAIEIDGRIYEGTVRVAIHGDGIAVTETTTVDKYLLGIREVPFSWEPAALEAQVVAARTYLAWTLERGRSINGRRYGYDICATVACQVYAGVGGVPESGGERWRRAVYATAGEILVYAGRPAQALYSSTSGGRTRNVEDVFGSSPIPYLKAVPSPDEQSPFVDWRFTLSGSQFQEVMEETGLIAGEITDVEMLPTVDGGGQTGVRFTSVSGEVTIGTWDLRSRINRAAGVLEGTLPALRGDGSGRRYPQTIMSPTYQITRQFYYRKYFGGAPVAETWFEFRGKGWGHLVGMSQYGAQAMAVAGAGHAEILSHYYSGLQPVDGTPWLPDRVTVGLSLGLDEVAIRPRGPVSVVKDGDPIGDDLLGSWLLAIEGDRLSISPPVGLGLAPELEGWRVGFDVQGRPTTARIVVPTAAEIRLIVEVGGVVVRDDGWVLVDASIQTFDWRDLVGPLRFDTPVELTLRARNPQGMDAAAIRLLPGLK